LICFEIFEAAVLRVLLNHDMPQGAAGASLLLKHVMSLTDLTYLTVGVSGHVWPYLAMSRRFL
jgi:hypothetical protein